MKNDKIRVGFIGANPPTYDVPAQSPTRIGRQPVDVIIVGGGSAGAVLPMRLSADAQHV